MKEREGSDALGVHLTVELLVSDRREGMGDERNAQGVLLNVLVVGA